VILKISPFPWFILVKYFFTVYSMEVLSEAPCLTLVFESLNRALTNTVISKATCMSFPLVGNPS
jgi:hypothetical protein